MRANGGYEECGLKARAPARATAMRLRGTEAATLRVLGIDPGSQRTGFGVLDAVGTRLTYVASGVIRTQTVELADGRGQIFPCVPTTAAKYRPHACATQGAFVNTKTHC